MHDSTNIVHELNKVHVGDTVNIKTGDLQEITGRVEEILTKVNYHHLGIKVKLDNNAVGRVMSVYLSTTKDKTIEDLKQEFLANINNDESETLEFKATFHVNFIKFENEKIVEKFDKGPHNIAKTIAAFANRNGGTLYVGVHDESRKILGLKEDYRLDIIKNPDGFLLRLKKDMDKMLGPIDYPKCVKQARILHFDKGDICVIKVVPTTTPIILKHNNNLELYVRENNQSSKYENIQAFCDYWCEHVCDLKS